MLFQCTIERYIKFITITITITIIQELFVIYGKTEKKVHGLNLLKGTLWCMTFLNL